MKLQEISNLQKVRLDLRPRWIRPITEHLALCLVFGADDLGQFRRGKGKNLSEVPKHADELLVYDNTVHGRGFRVVAHFIDGKLSKTAQTIPDWAAKVFGKELRAARQHEKFRRGR